MAISSIAYTIRLESMAEGNRVSLGQNGHKLGKWHRDTYHGLFHWWFSAATEKVYRKLGRPGRWHDYFKSIRRRTARDRRYYK